MADQAIPNFGFGTRSQMGMGEDTSYVQNLPIDELTEGKATNVGGPRPSGDRITQTVTPTSHTAGPSTPAPSNISSLLGLPEGKSLASWYAKQQATLNVIYQSLSAQQVTLQAEPSLVATPAPTQGARQATRQQNVKRQYERPPPQRR
ncbi:hypothetical protein Hanom_Chr02g00127041 [Helianthus anomalus]